MTDPMLFGGFPDPEPQPDPTEGMGHDAKRTYRQRQAIADGVHPATHLPLLSPLEERTCGDCIHLWFKHYRTFKGWKCDMANGPFDTGPDMRKWWPACTAWGAKS